MGFVSNMKAKIRQEIHDSKEHKRMDSEMETQHLVAEREMVRGQLTQLRAKHDLEAGLAQDRRELQTLKNSTGMRGRILGGLTSGLQALKAHTAQVQARNARQPPAVLGGPGFGNGPAGVNKTKSLIMQGPGASKGGVFAGGPSARPSKRKAGKTIIIKV